jgi:hypothetical protein
VRLSFSARVFSPNSSLLIFQAPFFIPAGSLLSVHVGRPCPASSECCWRSGAFLCAYSGFSPPPGLDVFCRCCCCCLIQSRWSSTVLTRKRFHRVSRLRQERSALISRSQLTLRGRRVFDCVLLSWLQFFDFSCVVMIAGDCWYCC